jgi:uncharacterized protein YjbJ (UPF0337 family)
MSARQLSVVGMAITTARRKVMWNKDEVEGKGKEIKGRVKDKVGEWTGNRDLEAEGEAEHAEGEVQNNFGEARRKAGEVVEDIGRAISGKR